MKVLIASSKQVIIETKFRLTCPAVAEGVSKCVTVQINIQLSTIASNIFQYGNWRENVLRWVEYNN